MDNAAPWENDPIVSQPTATPWENDPIVSQPKEASTLAEDFQAGLQGSSAGLAVRGKLPDIVLGAEHSKWYDKLAAGAGQLVGDFPAMAVGGLAGAVEGIPGGPIGAAAVGGAGAFALPTAIRQSYVEAYSKGEVTSWPDFLSRAAIVMKQTGKDALVGAATAGVGGVVGKVASPALSPVATAASRIGAEAGTLTVAPALLEGRAPDPEDAMNAAILMVGLKGAGKVGNKLMNLWAKTGVRPEQVVADAIKDPSIAADLAREPEPVGNPETPAPAKEGPVQYDMFGADKYYDDPRFKDPDIPQAYRDLAAQVKVDEAMLPDVRAEQVLNQPFAEIPEFKSHSNVNFDYIDGPDDVRAFVAKIAEEYRGEFTKQSRGVVSNEETFIAAQRRVEDIVGKDGVQKYLSMRTPGQAADAVDLKVYGDLMMDAANNAKLKAEAYAKAVDEGTATPEMKAEALMAQHKAGMTASQFVGAGSEVARALQIMKSLKSAKGASDAIKAINDLYGGDPDDLLRMAAKMDNPYGMLQLSKALDGTTSWRKYMEAMKGGLVGHISQSANILGTLGAMPLRPLVDAIAVPITRLTGKERMSYWEPVARVQGIIMGVFEGAKIASTILQTGVHVGDMKLDQHRVNISAKQYYKAAAQATMEGLKPGSHEFARRVADLRGWTIGEVYRLSFRGLGAADAVLRAMAERGEAHTIAARMALEENFAPFSKQYNRRIAELMQSDNPKIKEALTEAGDRATYTSPGGGIQQGVQQIIHAAPFVEMLIPFRSTPGNWLKELLRYGALSPVGNLMVSEWRADIKAGGIRQAKAAAELALGTSLMAGGIWAAANGYITGQGDPDPAKARVKKEVEPNYSFKSPFNDTYYELSRLGVIGTLLGLSADMYESRKYMSSEEANKFGKMIGTAFAHAVTDQTMLKGMVDFSRVFSEDSPRYIERFMENLAGMQLGLIPGFGPISQVAQNIDDYVREIQGPLDAVKNRIPFIRETLEKGIGPWGEPIANRDRVGGILAIRKFKSPDDYAIREAARLDVGIAKAPKSVKLEDVGIGKFGKVDLTPKQQHDYMVIAGHNAYNMWKEITSSPEYHDWNDLYREEAFNTIKDEARQIANDTILSPEQIRVESEKLKAQVAAELAKPPAN